MLFTQLSFVYFQLVVIALRWGNDETMRDAVFDTRAAGAECTPARPRHRRLGTHQRRRHR